MDWAGLFMRRHIRINNYYWLLLALQLRSLQYKHYTCVLQYYLLLSVSLYEMDEMGNDVYVSYCCATLF